jgi:hypothetical protein
MTREEDLMILRIQQKLIQISMELTTDHKG